MASWYSQARSILRLFIESMDDFRSNTDSLGDFRTRRYQGQISSGMPTPEAGGISDQLWSGG